MTKTGNPARFYSGLSGVVLPIPKYQFPEEFQQSTRLTYYSTFTNSIEINRSFYALPNPKTVAKWATEVPLHFRFTFKLWKEITHAKGLRFDEEHVHQFVSAINSIGEKKGCLLIQFPASVKSDCLYQLQHLLHVIHTVNEGGAWKIAIEFRDRSWYNDDTYEALTMHNAAAVIHDKAKTSSPHPGADAATVYLRFHGPLGDYRGSYTDEFLSEYATYIREWLEEGKSVFTYFNNTMGSAFQNLNTLNKLVAAA